MRYQTQKSSKPMSMFSALKKYKNLKQKRIVAKENLAKIEDRLDELLASGEYSPEEYNSLNEERKKIKNFLNNSNKFMASLKKTFMKVAGIVLSTSIVLSGAVATVSAIKQADLKKNIEEAKSYISEYSDFNTDKYNLDAIQNDPALITQLALNRVKAQIAKYLNISDPTTITISDNSTGLSASKNNPLGDGYLNDLSIQVNGKKIGEYRSFTPGSTGEKGVQTQTMSDDLVSVINSISKSQRSQDYSDATKALKIANSLNPLDMSFPNAAQELGMSFPNAAQELGMSAKSSQSLDDERI